MKRGLLCFDLDNTLIKSNRCHLAAYQLAFKKNHIQHKIPNSHILRYFGEGSRVIVEKLFPKASKSFIDTIVRDHDFFVCTQTAKHIVVIPGAREVLNKLRQDC